MNEDYWQVEGFARVTGEASRANYTANKKIEREIIPAGTRANAVIDSIMENPSEDGGPWCFRIVWKIIDGDYKTFFVAQKIKVNDSNGKIKDKAKNMLMRLYMLNDFPVPAGNKELNADDLQLLKGALCSIKIEVFEHADKTRFNWISSVDPYDAHKADANLSAKNESKELNDDITF